MRNRKLSKFYAITDRKKFAKPFLEQISQITKKTNMIQIREKDLPAGELLRLCKEIKSYFKEITLIINDRLDVALLSNADGVHLPEKSFNVKDVKDKFPDLIVGKSCHSLECAKKAEEEGADYITFSPIFYVPDKGNPQGLEKLKEVVRTVKIPVYALGGITEENLEDVLKTGVFGVAGIRLFLQ